MPEKLDRSRRQQEGIQKWLDSGCNSVWEYATGFGKSHSAITVIKRVLEKKPDAVCVVCVPTLYLQAQFYANLRRAGLIQVECFVINSFAKEEHVVDLLVIDEIHLMIGEEASLFPLIFERCKAKWRLGLSATLTVEEKQRLIELGMPVCDVVTMQEATKEGWIARCRTYNLGIELTDAERITYNRHNDMFNSTWARFGHDFGLAMSCVADRKVREEYARKMGWNPLRPQDDDRWDPKVLGAAANMWLRATHGRQEVVNMAANKLAAAECLCRELPVKAICFSESTAFATKLAEQMPDICRAYHSQIESQRREYTTVKHYKTKPDVLSVKTKAVGPTTIRQEALAAFADVASHIRVLSTAKALDQGADFQGLQLGIETSGNSSIRQKVQRTGRIVRADAIEDKLAVYVHIYALDTYETNKLKRKQKGIADIQWITDIHKITL